jgi:fatty acid-binding protein DegV
MEKAVFSTKNCRLMTDDSCCLNEEELFGLRVQTIPYNINIDDAAIILEKALDEKEFVLFVGTALSISDINLTIRDAATLLDEKDKRLNASDRVWVFNTSSFSGGLGFFVTLFAEFLDSGDKTVDDIESYALFLGNHITHFFIEPSQKRWNNIIYVPRTGKIKRSGERLRGNKGVYEYIVDNFCDFAYHPEEQVWICHQEEGKAEAKNLIKQFKHRCPKAVLNTAHQIQPNVYNKFSESVVACFFLSMDVRPDIPNRNMRQGHFDEIEEKRIIARQNITAISRYGQAFLKDPNPNF